MRKLILSAALAATMTFVGCESGTQDTYTNSSGSLALSRDDGLLYAADSDNDIVAVVDTQTQAKIAEVKVGRHPERVVVASDDSIYVTNRLDRSVSVIRKGDYTQVGKISVGVEPVGLAVSPDAKTLYVVNSAALDSPEEGTLQAINTESLQTMWEIKIGEEPRAIALVSKDKAFVTLYRRGELVEVDLAKHAVVKAPPAVGASDLYAAANYSRLNDDQSGAFALTYSSFKSRAAADLVVAPNGERAYMPVVWAREDRINTAPNSFGGYYSNGGPCNTGAIASAGVVTFKASTAEPLVDDLTSCAFFGTPEQRDYPPTAMGAATASEPVQGPVAAVVDPTGAWLFVVNRESKNVAVLPTDRRDGDDISFASTGSTIRSLVPVGAGANGIALTRDGTRAFVYNAFEHSVSVLLLEGEGSEAQVIRQPNDIVVATDGALSEDFVKGRKLFFDAHDSRMSNPSTGVACATCHLEGREDGHTWNFPDGPRQTPSLAGRSTLKTGPYHWTGEFATLGDFMTHTIRLRMGGSGLSDTQALQVATFIDSIPAPENPLKSPVLTESQARGHGVFAKAGCNSCHAGETFTNNQMANVGTFVETGANPDDLSKLPNGFNTPSLLTLARTAPYLHDGSAGTLKQRLLANKASNRHGQTATLTDAEMDDLVEYLRSL